MEVKPSENAEPTRKDELKKELDSYKANKPWREDLSVQEEKKGNDKKADDKASVGEKKDSQKADAPKKKGKKTKKPVPPADDADTTP